MRGGEWKLQVPLQFALLGGSFVFLDVGPSILFLIFPLFRVLWIIYNWQSFITLVLSGLGYSFVLQVCQPFQLDFRHLTHNGVLTELNKQFSK
jgi:hypothetical protein